MVSDLDDIITIVPDREMKSIADAIHTFDSDVGKIVRYTEENTWEKSVLVQRECLPDQTGSQSFFQQPIDQAVSCSATSNHRRSIGSGERLGRHHYHVAGWQAIDFGNRSQEFRSSESKARADRRLLPTEHLGTGSRLVCDPGHWLRTTKSFRHNLFPCSRSS